MAKSALVLGMCEYEDVKLASLHAPSADVKALARVLGDEALGAFEEVTEHTDEKRAVVETAITRLFANKQQDDLVVLYFSGHGLKDDSGDLYLAVKDTNHRDLDGTAVAADFIKRVMNKSNSRRQVLILDCCYSGAFSAGFKGGGTDGVEAKIGTRTAFDPDGFGRIILTASDATQYAWEGEKFTGEPQTSMYTGFLIEGIRSGAADLSRDGMITVDELHDYVYRKTVQSASKQRPTKICDREKGNLILSRAPLHASPLPEEVTSALRSPFASVRQAMVGNLVEMFQHQPAGTAISSYKALAAMADDDSKAVRQAAAEAITACRGARPEIDPSLLGEIVLAAAGLEVETPGKLLEMQKKQEEDGLEAKRILQELASKADRQREERAALDIQLKTAFADGAGKSSPTTLPATRDRPLKKEALIGPAEAESVAAPIDTTIDKSSPLAEELKQHAAEVQAAEMSHAQTIAQSERNRLDRLGASVLIRRDPNAGQAAPAASDPAEVARRLSRGDQAGIVKDTPKAKEPLRRKPEEIHRHDVGVDSEKAPPAPWQAPLPSGQVHPPVSFAAADVKKKTPALVWVYRVVGAFGVLMICEILSVVYFMINPGPKTATTSEQTMSASPPGNLTQNRNEKQGDPKAAGKSVLQACVFDPVSNVRTLPTDSSPIVCRIQTVETITVHATPLSQGNGVWWQTETCGQTGFIAGNQVHVDAACP